MLKVTINNRDHKTFNNAQARIVGLNLIVERKDEVLLIVPLLSVTHLEKVEDTKGEIK